MLLQLANLRESQANRFVTVAVIAVLAIITVTAGGGLVAGVAPIDTGDTHSGITAAQPEENETETEDSGTIREESDGVNESADYEFDGGDENETSGTDRRAESQVPDQGGNETGNETGNQTATEERSESQVPGDSPGGDGNLSGAGGGGGSGGLFDPVGQIISIIEGLTEQASEEFGELVSWMFELATSRSAPGVADDPSTWSDPDDPMWQGAIDVTELTRFMGGAIVLIAALYSVIEFFKDPRSAKRRIKWCLIAFVYLLNPTFWNGLTLHFSNSFSSTIIPSGEVFSTPEGILLIGLTVIIGGLLASTSLLIVAAAAFVTVIAHSAGFFTTMFLPLAISFYCMNMYLRSLGEMVVYLHGVTVFMPFFQALAVLSISRMALGSSGALGSVSGVLMFLGMIYLVFYLFQKEVLEKAFDAPITSLGVHGAQMSAEGAMNAKSTVQNAPEMFKNMKANIEANIESAKSRFTGSDGLSRPNIGGLQSQSPSRQSAAAVADGGYSISPPAKGADATSNTHPPEGDRRFQAIEENRERDRLAHGDY